MEETKITEEQLWNLIEEKVNEIKSLRALPWWERDEDLERAIRDSVADISEAMDEFNGVEYNEPFDYGDEYL